MIEVLKYRLKTYRPRKPFNLRGGFLNGDYILQIMLQKLLWWFYKYGETDIPDFDMKQLCIEDGLSVFPDLVTEITDMMVEVNGYIDTKARQDLPHQQYENDFANLNYNQLTEVGGFIKYYGGVEEIMYTPHSQGVEIKYNFPLGIDVGIPTFGEFKFEVKAEP